MLDIGMDKYLWFLMQVCDSNFPTGAFSHSFGLETYLQEKRVSDKKSFADWLNAYVREQLVHVDGLLCRLTYEALEQSQWETIWSLDRLVTMQNLARETREGNCRMGVRMAELGTTMFESQALAQYRDRMRSNQSFGHPAIVFAMIAYHVQVPLPLTVQSFLYSNMSSLIQNGVRGIPLGQTEGQLLVQELQSPVKLAVERIMQLELDDFGVVSPGIELSQMRHERLAFRLFMS